MVRMLDNARAYLFRGKASPHGRWVYGSLIEAEDFCCILSDDIHPMDYPYLDGDLGVIDGHVIPVEPDTVSQYIRGEDRNGIKLFEGDIVRVYYRKGLFEPTSDIAVVVDRDNLIVNGLGCWMPQDDTCLELIGNIWDNFDLLDENTKCWINNYFGRGEN